MPRPPRSTTPPITPADRRRRPYPKWLGTAFSRLPIAATLGPALERALAASTIGAREAALSEAYGIAGEAHNALDITPPLDTATTQFFDRPYRVLSAGRFAEALAQRIEDDEVRDILRDAGRSGAVDQLTDTTDLLMRPEIFGRLRMLYTAEDTTRELP